SLTIFLPSSYGYPFALVSEVIYRLEATRGLHVFIRTQNVGDEIAPYGAGAHPYLTCNLQPIDDCELTLPVIEETCDERYFTTPQRIAQTAIDHTFRTMPPDAEWEVRMTTHRKTCPLFYAATSLVASVYPAK
ncbi:hypothetical protein T481_11645, partial [Enterococcus faecalis PF3]